MYNIPLLNLALAFIPVMVVLVIIWKWDLNLKSTIIAVVRMLVQLMLIGYLLSFIFGADSSWIVLLVLMIMLLASAWISLRTMETPLKNIFLKALAAIVVGGGSVLLIITQGVLNLEPWYMPSYMIPLAGMIFANSMNSISLAGERLESEIKRDVPYLVARKTALNASLIPVINALLAVGIVSFPGMMTGQILSGVSPVIAARYQIMVMLMIFGAAGISTSIFLTMLKSNFKNA